MRRIACIYLVLIIGASCLLISHPNNTTGSRRTLHSSSTSSAAGSLPLWEPPPTTTLVTAPPASTTTTTVVVHPPVLAPAETTTPTTYPTATTAPPAAPYSGSTSDGGWTYEQAEKVAVCEEGGFGAPPAEGPTYYGWLGINAHNWAAYGCGTDYYSVQANIDCASKIQADPPDQDGCGGGW